jgi:hypothetical protein
MRSDMGEHELHNTRVLEWMNEQSISDLNNWSKDLIPLSILLYNLSI